MLNREIVQAWLDEAATTLEYDEGPTVPEGIESLDAAECDELLARLSLISRAVRFLQESARLRLVDHLGTRGFVRFGERTYRAAPKTDIKIKTAEQSDFWELVEKAGLARRLFNPNQARKGVLKELAEAYVDTATGEFGWDAFKERFLDITEGDVAITEQPRSSTYVPKYIANAPDGEPQKRGDAA